MPASIKPYRASLFVQGLHSLQAITKHQETPDVTIYRDGLGNLLEQLKIFVKAGRFEYFALKKSNDRVEFYDRCGNEILDEQEMPLAEAAVMLPPQQLLTTHSEVLSQAIPLIKSPTEWAVFEAHAGYAAARRSNYYTMLDQVLGFLRYMGANRVSDKDRAHVYVLESYLYPWAVSILVVDLDQASVRTQELYKKYINWIQKGWPLHERHHRAELERTLAGCRYDRLSNWLTNVRMIRHPSEDEMRFQFVLQSIPLRLRSELAGIFVDKAYPKFWLTPGGVEELSDENVRMISDQVGEPMDQLLAKPLWCP